ncbi:MAG: DUF5998 family protein [Propioniciclava sp.]
MGVQQGLPAALDEAIVASGYFPALVAATLGQAVGEEMPLDWLVHHEATFTSQAVHRHITVLVLTPTRLIVAHTDDGSNPDVPQALTTVEALGLRSIRSVGLTQVAGNPEQFGSGPATMDEAWLVVNWGAVRRVEIEPATCGDPSCEADHGLTAQDVADDLTVRVSAAADGAAHVADLVRFGTNLQLRSA